MIKNYDEKGYFGIKIVTNERKEPVRLKDKHSFK